MPERMCWKNCGRPATNKRGRPVCGECHNRVAVRERTCQCGKRFKTSNSSTRCSTCHFARMKKPCPQCGQPMDHRASTCKGCRPPIDQTNRTYRSGPDNPQWKGGRRVRKTGYVDLYMPGHPRATAQNVVPEHTLVMEEMLGRYLLPGETAHHKNGVRGDNRPENLELWVKSQPAGQRAIDLVVWAREILDRYGELV